MTKIDCRGGTAGDSNDGDGNFPLEDYQRFLRGKVRRLELEGGANDQDDFCQAVSLDIWEWEKNGGKLKFGKKAVLSFLSTVIKRRMSDFIRRQSQKQKLEKSTPDADLLVDPDCCGDALENLVREEEREQRLNILCEVEKKNPEFFVYLILHHALELSRAEACELSGCNIHTVEKWHRDLRQSADVRELSDTNHISKKQKKSKSSE